MKITPLDIDKQEFKKTMRGYDPAEVDTFLEVLAKEYERLIGENQNYEKKLLELETELKNYKEVERTLKQTLMNVQENSTKSRENSKKEADLIRKEAELSAAEMMENARREKQTLKEELVTLQTQKQSLIARLRHVLKSQLELMDVLEIEDVDITKLKDRTKKVFSRDKKSTGAVPPGAQESDDVKSEPGKEDDKSGKNRLDDFLSKNPDLDLDNLAT